MALACESSCLRSRPGETSSRCQEHCRPPKHASAGAAQSTLQRRTDRRSPLLERVVLRCQAVEGPQQMDVSSIFVDTAFRSTPWAQEAAEESSTDTSAKILFVSESNVCRDYNAGEGPDATVLEVAHEAGIHLPADFRARQLQPEVDIVHYDLVCVMDKFTAADVLREVSVFDTINSAGGYSRRVRRLGEFHPRLAKIKSPDGQDIDDPLYGNVGGAAEKEAVRETLGTIQEACEGLAAFLVDLQGTGRDGSGNGSGAGLRERLADAVKSFEDVDWLVPPMLQTR